ncbi:MAG: helix-turn-helix transcriptional regulator [Pseudomonadota bacterium]
MMASALAALNALSQQSRLETFRVLVQAGQSGMAAGVIAQRLGIAPSSLSFHLTTLKHAGLVSEERRSRSKIYTANFAAMSRLIAFLMANCCAADSIDPQWVDAFSQGELSCSVSI